MNHDDKIKVFFEGVEKAGNTLDLDLIDSQFADQFIFADPNGTRVVEKQKFLPVPPQTAGILQIAWASIHKSFVTGGNADR